MDGNQRIAVLREIATREIKHRERELNQAEKDAGRQIPKATAGELNARSHAIERARRRLDEYSPVPGKEHCPRCFVLEGETVALDLSGFHGDIDKPVGVAACHRCGLNVSIPVVGCIKNPPT